MAKYGISGVWKDNSVVITHYAFHEVDSNTNYRAIKKTKLQAIALLEQKENKAITIIWNYNTAEWNIGIGKNRNVNIV